MTNNNMKKNIKITVFLVAIAGSLLACENKKTNSEASVGDSLVGGLNSQPVQEVNPATPYTNDSLANETKNENPLVGGMDGQLQQEVNDSVKNK
ncbi:hypothetical protein ETU10_02925 [Apibacter muscae]|nr:hypothetical protein ETU10_02925 [Apibacter muscae]